MKEEDLKDLEKKLWESADKMRGAVPVSSYKFIVLGLIFLKYISDSFEEKYQELVEEGYGLEEDRDSYMAENIFYVPARARWEYLNAHSKDANIGQIIDEALEEIEKENPSLKGVLIKQYKSPDYKNVNLGELIDIFTNVKIGNKEAQDKDILGRIYEYFLGQFASNELQKGGEFYTPACLVRTMVECIEPYKGRIYDPACGSGGMFVQSMKFIQRHQGNINDLNIFGQEKNPTTWKLAKMNLAIRGLNNEGLGKFADDTFHNDLHKDLKADFVLANPPYFKVSSSSQKNENLVKQIARHEVTLNLADVIMAAKRNLKENGTFYMVHRVDRLLDSIHELEKAKFGLRKIVFIHTILYFFHLFVKHFFKIRLQRLPA